MHFPLWTFGSSVYIPIFADLSSLLVLVFLVMHLQSPLSVICKKGSPYSITEHRVPELIPVFGSQSAGDTHTHTFNGPSSGTTQMSRY